MTDTSSKVCGYVVLTDHWFEDDPPASTTGYTIYVNPKNDNLPIFDRKLREHWESAIKPKYANSQRTFFTYYDIKSNPRRIHPFQKAYSSWYLTEVPEFVQGLTNRPPVLILKPVSVQRCGYWRDGLNDVEITKANSNIIRTDEFYQKLSILQRWCRSICQRKEMV